MIKPLSLFSRFGVELEYMIVDKDSLEVLPIADKIIYDVEDEFVSDVERGKIAWSNEIVLHVIELKTNGARKSLKGLSNDFQTNIKEINQLLNKYNAMLLPGGTHPFMDPSKSTKLWPHDNNSVYESYNRIFDCRGHGWSNLQSTHLNLPFANDKEFEKLHAAIRFLLPVLPAITASTPIIDGKKSGFADTRLEVYRNNQKKIPSIAGKIIPERVYSKSDYEKLILNRIYKDISPYDPQKILQYEWLNSRGAITRFDRYTIEIRTIDSQESPIAEVAIVAFVVEILNCIINEKWSKLSDIKDWHEDDLYKLLINSIKDGENSVIKNRDYLKNWGISGTETLSREFWANIFESVYSDADDEVKKLLEPVKLIIERGTLSKRILKALGDDFSHSNIINVYSTLADCLRKNILFLN